MQIQCLSTLFHFSLLIYLPLFLITFLLHFFFFLKMSFTEWHKVILTSSFSLSSEKCCTIRLKAGFTLAQSLLWEQYSLLSWRLPVWHNIDTWQYLIFPLTQTELFNNIFIPVHWDKSKAKVQKTNKKNAKKTVLLCCFIFLFSLRKT